MVMIGMIGSSGCIGNSVGSSTTKWTYVATTIITIAEKLASRDRNPKMKSTPNTDQTDLLYQRD